MPLVAESELLVFSDDWGRHPSSCQHIVRQLLPDNTVYWVNTIGTRPPRFDLLTLRRGAGKLKSWSRRKPEATEKTASTPQVLQPLMWPSFGSRWGRRINRALLSRACRRLPDSGRFRIAITTIPLVADLVGRTPVDRWIYYCVDDLSQWPGLDRSTLESMERELVSKVDKIVAVSDNLVDRMYSLGRTADLLTHGVDVEHWTQRAGSVDPLQGYVPPIVLFWGVIDRRLDVEVLKALGHQIGKGTILLIGPSNNPPRELDGLDRVRRLGALPYEDLPAVARQAAVLIMPYGDSPATRAMQPLKLKEYLATGKPVVVTNLPAVSEWADACDVEASPERFAEAVAKRIASGISTSQVEARRRLAAEDWPRKAERFMRLVSQKESA